MNRIIFGDLQAQYTLSRKEYKEYLRQREEDKLHCEKAKNSSLPGKWTLGKNIDKQNNINKNKNDNRSYVSLF